MDDISSATDGMQCPLPPEVLQLMLQHVDLRQRLGPCALVCRAWRAAANAATSSVSTDVIQQQGATALSDWLQQHGGHVEQLQIKAAWFRNFRTPDLALPCHQLTKLDKLEIDQFNVRPITIVEGRSSRGVGSGSNGPHQQHLAALTRLTQLHLAAVGWAGSLQPLSTLTNLRQLHLHGVGCLGDDPGSDALSALDDAAVCGAASHLVQLTSLSLSGFDISDASLAHIGRLQQLQELELLGLRVVPAGLFVVPQSLTRLQLVEPPPSVATAGMARSSITVPALAQPTALQHLELFGRWNFEAVLLSQMAQLTHLQFQYIALLPAGSEGAAALLAAVARMTVLQHLELAPCLYRSHAPAGAYAALTASSQLTYLRVSDSRGPLPAGALNHMFAAGRLLSNLQKVFLGFKQEQQEQQQQALPDHLALWQEGFDQLLQCCPGLRSLDLLFAVHDDAEHQPPMKLDGLLALSGLSHLALYGLCADEGGITNTLAQLTGLRQLTLPRSGVGHPVLLQLTTLQHLERLHLIGHDGFKCWARPGAPPDVWQKLQEWCVSSCKECAELVLQQKDAQLTAAGGPGTAG